MMTGEGAMETTKRDPTSPTSSVPAIESRDFAFRFAIGRALLEIGAFIVRDFSLRHADLGFQLAVFPIRLSTTSARPAMAVKP